MPESVVVVGAARRSSPEKRTRGAAEARSAITRQRLALGGAAERERLTEQAPAARPRCGPLPTPRFDRHADRDGRLHREHRLALEVIG